jgi:hypothetical protein
MMGGGGKDSRGHRRGRPALTWTLGALVAVASATGG